MIDLHISTSGRYITTRMIRATIENDKSNRDNESYKYL
jgi:hypothetical protein